MRQPCWLDVGASGTNVSAAGSNDTTASKPLNCEPAAVTSMNRSKSVPGVTVCEAGVSPTLTWAAAGAATAASASRSIASPRFRRVPQVLRVLSMVGPLIGDPPISPPQTSLEAHDRAGEARPAADREPCVVDARGHGTARVVVPRPGEAVGADPLFA